MEASFGVVVNEKFAAFMGGSGSEFRGRRGVAVLERSRSPGKLTANGLRKKLAGNSSSAALSSMLLSSSRGSSSESGQAFSVKKFAGSKQLFASINGKHPGVPPN